MEPVIEIKNLVKHFPVVTSGVILRKYKMLKAVDGVSFSIDKRACFGLAGESGSGKTTISKLILLMEKITAGSILYEGKDISKFTDKDILVGVSIYVDSIPSFKIHFIELTNL